MPQNPCLAGALACLLTASAPARAGDAPPPLAGQWVADLPAPDTDETIRLVIDVGPLGARWVGTFDLIGHVENYPIEVVSAGDSVRLYLTAMAWTFEGAVSAAGDTLSGSARTEGEEAVERVVFRRVAPEPSFSAEFLALEAASDDLSRLEVIDADAAALAARFDADRERVRLVLLLSPT